jgi:hypothetical protein
MKTIAKRLALLLIMLMTTSSLALLMVKPANAQTSTPMPTPSVPSFTVKFVDASYDVPTTTSIDQYTGKSVTNQGYHVENKTIVLSIDNRPFRSYLHNNPPTFFYNVRAKGAFAQNWTELYSANAGYLMPSNSDYTVIARGLPTPEGQIDYQVQAMAGGVMRISPRFSSGDEFIGVTSSWSFTQSVTIPASSDSPTPTPLPSQPSVSPTIPEFSCFAVVAILASWLSITLIVRHRKKP